MLTKSSASKAESPSELSDTPNFFGVARGLEVLRTMANSSQPQPKRIELSGPEYDAAHADRKPEFIELMTKHWHQLFNVIFCVVQNFADTEDVFQQTTMALWSEFHKFESGTDFGAWASTVARYRISTFIRSKKRQRVYFSEDLIKEIASLPMESDEAHDARLAALADCRKKLSSTDQELIALCYGGSDSIRDAAYRIGRPVESVYVRLTKIRSALYACIERYLARESYQ